MKEDAKQELKVAIQEWQDVFMMLRRDNILKARR